MTESFLPQEVIRRKREGKTLDTDELHQFIGALTSGDLSDAQLGAFAMAVCLQGMTASECAALTIAMRDSTGLARNSASLEVETRRAKRWISWSRGCSLPSSPRAA